jgi:hypothetical protein
MQINITPNISPNTNFFELNPQFIAMHPYSLLEGKEKDGSNMMWSIFFLVEPDRSKNIFAQFGREDTVKRLVESGFAEEWYFEDEDFKNAYAQFPLDHLTAAQHALRTELESLKLRTEIFQALQAKIRESLEEDTPDHKNIVLLNSLQKDSPAIYKNYKTIRDEFLDEKTSVKRRGSRKKTSLGE